MKSPTTRYAKSGDISVAYQVVGDGPLDLVFCVGWLSNVEIAWEEPGYARFLRNLASFSRLILFDKRGTGLSDRLPLNRLPTLENRMDDVRAVLDAVGSEHAAVFGFSEGGVLAALFAATYPERCKALVMYGTPVKWLIDDEAPWGWSKEFSEQYLAGLEAVWGEQVGVDIWAPSKWDDAEFKDWLARSWRQAASPQAAVTMARWILEVDIRPTLPTIRVPTLILHRAGDMLVDAENSRYAAAKIPGAKIVELDGIDHLPYVGDSDSIVEEVQEFLTGIKQGPATDRVLATVMFVDIVQSTEFADKIGDKRWRYELERFYAMVRGNLQRFRGREVKTTGDGLLATFDGPARGIRCACAIRDEAPRLGMRIRAGLHTGECEIMGEDVGGMAVHIGARVAAEAAPNEVMASRTVKDLVVGSGLEFVDRGERILKGIPGLWHLYAVEL